MRCPICKSKEFGDYRGRPKARCAKCGSFERSRLLFLVLNALRLEGQSPIFHFAPEIGIARHLRDKFGSRYKPFDFCPEIYAKTDLGVKPFDLCKDLAQVTDNSVAMACHIHVMEHVRCNAATVFKNINRCIAPKGYHVFGIPFAADYFKENLDPRLTEDFRLEEFGHEDHVRSFGSRDFDLMFSDAFEGMRRIPLDRLISKEDVAQFGVPERAFASGNSHSIYIYQKL